MLGGAGLSAAGQERLGGCPLKISGPGRLLNGRLSVCLQGLRLSLARMRLAKDKAEATVSELESNVQMHRAAAAALKQVSANSKRTHMLLGTFVQLGATIQLKAA